MKAAKAGVQEYQAAKIRNRPLQVVRTYEARKSKLAQNKFQEDAERLARDGYEVVSTSVIERHAGVGRKLVSAGLAAGKSSIIVTYTLREETPTHISLQQPSPSTDVDQLEKLANLRDRGIVTEDEFQAKKRQILGP
ncbi:MAG: SHOCT domain-containing protein [Chloroflexota bacterium]